MNIVVHYPKTQEGQRELAKRMAECHAKAVEIQLRKMNITNEDRRKIIGVMCERLKDQASRGREYLIQAAQDEPFDNTEDAPDETLGMA
ncbi:MAG: hypothetical protein K2I93_08695, partial [Oscillospiraceae bacterium]|nr:hypothetical protein [Oscillospiraceae bacterium]